jgi:hypothetical protein
MAALLVPEPASGSADGHLTVQRSAGGEPASDRGYVSDRYGNVRAVAQKQTGASYHLAELFQQQ